MLELTALGLWGFIIPTDVALDVLDLAVSQTRQDRAANSHGFAPMAFAAQETDFETPTLSCIGHHSGSISLGG